MHIDASTPPVRRIARNVLAVLAGTTMCMLLNAGILEGLMVLLPPPPGFDPGDTATYHLLDSRHYLPPFLAHALPSLIGAHMAARLAASHHLKLAMSVGCIHLLGGIAAAFMIPAPTWFLVLDLGAAYLPMAWMGGRAVRIRSR